MYGIGRSVVALRERPFGVRNPKEFEMLIRVDKFIKVLNECIKFLRTLNCAQTKSGNNIERYLSNDSKSSNSNSSDVEELGILLSIDVNYFAVTIDESRTRYLASYASKP